MASEACQDALVVDGRRDLRESVARLRTATAGALAEATDSPLRQLVQAVADEVGQVEAELEQLYDNASVDTDRFFGLYRGTVVNNDDPTGRGRLQLTVPEISDEPLGWALRSLPFARWVTHRRLLPPSGSCSNRAIRRAP